MDVTCDVCGRPYALEASHEACEARIKAYRKAVDVFGEGATVGYGCLLQNGTGAVYFVGRTARGLFEYLGTGKDWDEAFKNTRRVLIHVPREKIILEALPKDKKDAENV